MFCIIRLVHTMLLGGIQLEFLPPHVVSIDQCRMQGVGEAQGAAAPAPPPMLPQNLIITLIFLTNSVDLMQG